MIIIKQNLGNKVISFSFNSNFQISIDIYTRVYNFKTDFLSYTKISLNRIKYKNMPF